MEVISSLLGVNDLQARGSNVDNEIIVARITTFWN